MNENVEYVKKVLPKPVLFVQLAEECDELGQAALKMFRILDLTDEPRDVADPWYTGNFDVTFRDIELGCQLLIDHFTKK